MSLKHIIAFLLSLALLGCGAFFVLKAEHEDDASMKNLYTQVEPLERQREKLLEEKKKLESEYALKSRDYATLGILFTKPDAQIVSEAWPIMRERGVVGMVGIGVNNLPGNYGNLSYADLSRLIADGWETCMLVDKGTSSFTDLYQLFSNMLSAQNFPMPVTVYFKDGSYNESFNEELKACGIHTVITDAENGRSRTVTDVNDALWFTGAMPWGYTGCNTDIELLGRTDGGNLILTFEFHDTWKKAQSNSAESTEKTSFTSTLDNWKEYLYEDDPFEGMDSIGPTPYMYVDTSDPEVLHELYLNSLTPDQLLLMPKFRSATAETARVIHIEVQAQARALSNELEAKRAQIDSQLTELDQEISGIYKSHSVSLPYKFGKQ